MYFKTTGKRIFIIILILVLVACLFVLIQSMSPDSETDIPKTCIITQHADESGRQSNFYTITVGDKLIVIDGGWAENADYVRSIIREHGGHVDAWIISHPHQDHAGAFNIIYADLQDITIDTIYDNSYDYDFVEKEGEPFDDITIMETFHALTKDAPNLVHLQRNETLDICGIEVYVLNAFDDAVLEHVGERHDYQNAASLCLKFTYQNESFLFTGDIKKDMNDYLEETYGNVLAATYVQISHHGNQSLSKDCYDNMDAQIYFLDAPSSISDNPDYGAFKLKQHLLEQGKTVYDFSTAPNTVELGKNSTF